MSHQTNPKMTMPLSRRGKPIIFCEYDNDQRWVQWGDVTFQISRDQINKIMEEFFAESDCWYPLGASMTEPIQGGLGEYVRRELPPYGPRHASAIAAMMAHEGLIEYRGKNPIVLRKRGRSSN